MTERAVSARGAAPSCHCEERSDEALSRPGDRHAPKTGLAMTERAVIARSVAPSCHCEERSDEAISSQGDRHAPLALAMTDLQQPLERRHADDQAAPEQLERPDIIVIRNGK